jgi:hypothetical protein
VDRDELIEKLADTITEGADLDSLLSYFREGQIDFLESMGDADLLNYASEILGYDVKLEEDL